MPDKSSIQKFITTLKTGKTDITNALDFFFTDSEDINTPGKPTYAPGVYDELKKSNILNKISGNAILENPLLNWGLTADHLKHIDNWDDAKKETVVRPKLIKAIENDLTIHFFWQLYPGTKEDIGVQDPNPDEGPISNKKTVIISFLSPRGKVSLDAGASGEVHVQVG